MKLRSALVPLASSLLLVSCGGGSSGGGGTFEILEASNGFGRLLPYSIPRADEDGLPTTQLVEIRDADDLIENLTDANPILPPTEWPVGAILPTGAAGNHFFYVRFTREIDIAALLSDVPSGGGNNNLAGPIQVVSVDPMTGVVEALQGRGFVGGRSFGPGIDIDTGNLAEVTWTSFDPVAQGLVSEITDAVGFPGTETGFPGDRFLVDPSTFVFVADTDDDLSTHEAFPMGLQIQIQVGEDVVAVDGTTLVDEGVASTTVGPDTIPAEVLAGGAQSTPVIVPGNGQTDVDPLTKIEVRFTEPVQALTIGSFATTNSIPVATSAIQLQIGPQTQVIDVPYTIDIFSPYDLSRIELTPTFPFPGASFDDPSCGGFSRVRVVVNPFQFEDLCGNRNVGAPNTEFFTREGPGLVNAPVLPEAIYIGRGGTTPGISVVDLNGFGQSTGSPAYDPAEPGRPGNSNYRNHPDLLLQPTGVIPPLVPGTCSFDGGSAGVFTLTKDTSLQDLHAQSPILLSVEDMAVGQPLDIVFNNAAPFGCQAGGGNVCSVAALRLLQVAFGGAGSVTPLGTGAFPVQTIIGGGNTVTFSPHPNPPPLVFPPLCVSPAIGGREPSSVDSPALMTQLVPGPNIFPNPTTGAPPNNIPSPNQTALFASGPSRNAILCLPFATRQQIGHFLYVADRVAGEVVVLNSNRFTVIDRIPLPDPTDLAMSPNLDLLAVSNQGADSVSFINIDPTSARFHQVVRTTRVGVGPTGIAWEVGNEDILVCNTTEGTVSVISAFTLNVRKVLRNQLSRPIDVAMTPRQVGFSFLRGVYFAYILDNNGRVAVFESGPDGINGFGFDDIIATLPFTFSRPKAIQPDITSAEAAVFIVHENRLDFNGFPTGEVGGALSRVGIASAQAGIIPIDLGSAANPNLRDMEFGVFASIGEGERGLTGVPVDLATDNMTNIAILPNFSTTFSAGTPTPTNGKSLIKSGGTGAGTPLISAQPRFLFLAVPETGSVDVLEIDSGTYQRFDTDIFTPGIQSISAPNATVLADYFRQ